MEKQDIKLISYITNCNVNIWTNISLVYYVHVKIRKYLTCLSSNKIDKWLTGENNFALFEISVC